MGWRLEEGCGLRRETTVSTMTHETRRDGSNIRTGEPVTVFQMVVQPHCSPEPVPVTVSICPLLWKASWAWWLPAWALTPAARAAATAKRPPFMIAERS